MGMYTEIFVNVDLKEETPESVLSVLRAMCGGGAEHMKGLPDRWRYLFHDGSYYTPRTCVSNLTFDKIANAWSLLGKGDIKNYEHEIEQFFEWLMPWIDAEDGSFIGYTRYEEDQLPQLVLKKGPK